VPTTQWDFAKMLVNQPLTNWFVIEKLAGFVREPDVYPQRGARGNVLLKNVFQTDTGKLKGDLP
jgi:hypothetical protein